MLISQIVRALDGKTRFVPASTNPDLLRALFSAGWDEAVGPGLPWYEALFTKPIGFIMGPWLLLTLCGAVGSAAASTG